MGVDPNFDIITLSRLVLIAYCLIVCILTFTFLHDKKGLHCFNSIKGLMLPSLDSVPEVAETFHLQPKGDYYNDFSLNSCLVDIQQICCCLAKL